MDRMFFGLIAAGLACWAVGFAALVLSMAGVHENMGLVAWPIVAAIGLMFVALAGLVVSEF